MNHVSILSILLMTASVTPALAQDSGQQLEDEAAAAFESAIKEYDIPGLIVGVTHGGKHSFYQTGLASREDRRSVTPDTLFELGSISKIFNVTLAAMAEAQGRCRSMPRSRVICRPCKAPRQGS
ncbi:serine hydrolase [Paracoccus cavernae]|uniref:Beta-lactamase n=1 Tax=Paracoccus cavernae TaxID=1571207 RepID=A0ABT8D8V2_9RHOB|nr:serine hydrolase [Paracoccus cavernae]